MDVPNGDWKGHVFLGRQPGVVGYVGDAGLLDEHAHHAIEIVIGLREPVRAQVADAAWFETDLLTVAGDVSHRMEATTDIALILIDPQSAIGTALLTRREPLAPLMRDLIDAAPADVRSPAVDAWLGDLFGRLASLTSHPAKSDAVAGTIDYVMASIADGELPRLSAAAGLAGLSESRLTHLFTHEVGIPFRRFVLSRRLIDVVERVAQGSDLTTAAAAAGFADSAHLSRTFRRNFGLSPSAMLQMSFTSGAIL